MRVTLPATIQTQRLHPAPAQLRTWRAVVLLAFGLLVMPALMAPAFAQSVPPAKPPVAPGGDAIVAVVNGDVISRADLDNRTRLFALATALPMTPDVLERLNPQVLRQLIDERLRLQEAQRRHVIVSDKDVAAAIADIEKNNGMAPGQLRARLAGSGVSMRTLIDQFRVQIAWGRVLRQLVGQKGEPSDADIADQAAQAKAQIGQPQYRVSEIFVPVSGPGQDAQVRRFTDTIIQQLRAGAPFSVVAAQFSQSQTALQGGDLGWVASAELDPAVLRVVEQMPAGAVSNPIQVPGGYSIVTLRGKRLVGKETSTLVKIRQAWFPFTQSLNPEAPTAQQISQLQAARKLSASANSCPQIEAANEAQGKGRPSDPGDLVLEQLANPNQRQLLGTLPIGKPSEPLTGTDGILVLMVCSRDVQTEAAPNRDALMEKIFNDRVELASRQLMRDLQRQAVIDQRG